MTIVLNSTPLIYLAKVGLISLIAETEEDLLIPGLVFDEVVTVGKQRGDVDAFIIEECVKRGTIKIVYPASKFTGFESEIHAAERDVMALAIEYGCIAIIDDGIAREIGEMCNVSVHGTFYLIFQATRCGSLSKQKAIGKINEMIRKGWRIGSEQYIKFLELIDEI